MTTTNTGGGVPEVAASGPTPPAPGRRFNWFFGLVPLVLLALVLVAFFAADPLSSVREDVPPVEELTFDRVVLNERPHEIVVRVTNGGPDATTIAQVLVDDAYWDHTVEPSREIDRLRGATLRIPYPWVVGEVHALKIISATGVTFEHEIEVAVQTPGVDGETLWIFTMLGLFVGVIPVALGLLWFPFVRRLDPRWVGFVLALTAGLLVFLAADALHESLEIAGDVPGALQGVGLVVIGVLLALAVLFGVDAWLRRRTSSPGALYVAVLIAIGIGLHNLGEGLAIGAAYAIGEVGFTTFLIVGFMVHNLTEGLGIVSPLARTRATVWQLAGLGAIAGVPTIIGTWAGGLAYSPAFAVLFLSIGVGAIIQVVWQVAKLIGGQERSLTDPIHATGFVAGLLVMYATGVFVAA